MAIPASMIPFLMEGSGQDRPGPLPRVGSIRDESLISEVDRILSSKSGLTGRQVEPSDMLELMGKTGPEIDLIRKKGYKKTAVKAQPNKPTRDQLAYQEIFQNAVRGPLGTVIPDNSDYARLADIPEEYMPKSGFSVNDPKAGGLAHAIRRKNLSPEANTLLDRMLQKTLSEKELRMMRIEQRLKSEGKIP